MFYTSIGFASSLAFGAELDWLEISYDWESDLGFILGTYFIIAGILLFFSSFLYVVYTLGSFITTG